MLDKLLALVSIVCFLGFIGILVFYVTEPDLVIICGIVGVMAIYDFFLLTRPKAKDESNSNG
jgi:hypothetical protein